MQRYYDVDPIVNELYVDNNGNKYSVLVTNEEHRVVDSRVILNGLPDPGYRVVVESNGNILTEVSLNEKLSDNTKYKVNYANGFVNLHSSLEGQTVNVKQYHSRGLTYFPASRVYTELDEWGKVKETVADIEGSIAQVIEVTETLPDKLEQVIEAGQTIDNEMPKIEEFGRQFNELKQMSEEATVQANIIMDFMSQVDGATDELQEQILKSQEQYELLQSSKDDTDALIGRLEILDGQIQVLINSSNTTRTELANSILTFNNEVGDIVDRLDTLEGNLSGYETNINALIEKADKARQMLQDTIDGSDLGGYATKIELNTKADLGEDGKVVAEQMPKIFGRNLLVGSKVNVTNSDYLIYKFPLSEPIQNGEIYTITVKGKLGEDRDYFGAYNIGGSISLGALKSLGDDMHSRTFKWSNTDPIYGETVLTEIWLYVFPNGATTKSTVEWATLVRGEVGTKDWIPSEKDFAPTEHTHPTLPTQVQLDRASLRENDITNPTALDENTDLNKVLEPGYYFVRDNNISKMILNSPTQYAFGLRVYETNVDSIVQELKEYGNWEGSRLFIREIVNTNIAEWREILTVYNIANDLNTISAYKALGASQGKKIWDHIVANQANWNRDTIYTHPANHPATMITEDETHRFATDAEKSTWNAKQNALKAGSNISIATDGTISATDKDTVTTINGKTGTISKADITALGIPDKDTTYGVATTSANGLMSSVDKTKMDNLNVNGIKVSTTNFTTSTLPNGWLGIVLG